MPFRLIRVRHLELKTYCPNKSRRPSFKDKISSHRFFCPSCVLPLVVAFIFLFTVSQLIVIHRTIESYKSRNQAYHECYDHDGTNPTNDSRILIDLAFSRKFSAAWPNSSVEWRGEQSYPYRLRLKRPIHHTWNSICPEKPSTLRGYISINVSREVPVQKLLFNNTEVKEGGRWEPKDCSSRAHVAIIIPYRDRWKHLKFLLDVLHPMLQRQQLAYQIFVTEQYGNYTFNKGVIMNAAFLLAMNASYFDCVIFHDVDLLPEDDRNSYACESTPAHLSVRIDAFGYRLPYVSLVGGVFAIRVEQFIQVNGYSNLYWGYGAEDDDMYNRIIARHMKISRPYAEVSRYKMLQHGPRQRNKFIEPLIRTARLRYPKDGLTNCKFRLVSALSQPLFTHFFIDVGQPSYSMSLPHLLQENHLGSTTKIPEKTSSTSSPANKDGDVGYDGDYEGEGDSEVKTSQSQPDKKVGNVNSIINTKGGPQFTSSSRSNVHLLESEPTVMTMTKFPLLSGIETDADKRRDTHVIIDSDEFEDEEEESN